MTPMRVIHRRDVIRGARRRWIEQYRRYQDDSTPGWTRGTFASIRKALAALDLETCSVADVDAAIGTTGWARNNCDQCGRDCASLVRIGDEPDYEARYQDLCVECLQSALAAIQESQ